MIPTCCKNPTVIRFGDCFLCIKDACLGGWVWRQACKHPTGGYQIKKIKAKGTETWLDFLQFWRYYAWRKAAEGGGSVGHLDVVTATTRYLYGMRLAEEPTRQEAMPARQKAANPNGHPTSLEELLALEAESLTDTPQPYYKTLANELVTMIGPNPEAATIALALAGQMEPQDAAVLLKQPIAATVARLQATKERLRDAA